MVQTGLPIEDMHDARILVESIIETMPNPLIVMDGDLRVITASPAFYRTFKVSPADTRNRLIYELGDRQWDIRELREQLESVISEKRVFTGFEVKREFPDIGRKIMHLSGRRIEPKNGGKIIILLVIEDVTAGVEAREAYDMIDQSPDLVIRLNARRQYLFVNRAFWQTAGVSAEEILGRRGEVHLPRHTVKFIGEAIDRVESARDEITAEIPFGNRWFLSTVKPEIDTSGSIQSFMIFAKEITERKHAEEGIKQERQRAMESEQRFRTVLETSMDAAYRRDLRTDAYDYISPVIEQITGYTPDEFSAKDMDTVVSLIHPEDISSVHEVMKDIMDRKDAASGRVVYRLKGKDGAYRWLADNLIVLRDETGTPRYLVGNIRDVTESMQLQENLRISKDMAEKRAREAEEGERILEAVMEHVPEGLAILDAQNQSVLTVSRYLAQFAGKDREDYEGISLAQYLESFEAAHMDGTPIRQNEAPIWRSIHQGELVVNEQYLLASQDGKKVSVLINTAPILGSGGRVIGGIATWRNVEPLIQAEREMKASRDAAEEAAHLAGEQQRILEAILVSIPEAILVLEAPDGRLRLASRYYLDFVGISPEKLMKTSIPERFGMLSGYSVFRNGAEFSQQYPAFRALSGETIMNEEWNIRKPDGSVVVVSVAAAPVRAVDGDITHAVVSWRDISVPKEMETTLRRSEHELKTLVESSPDIIIRMDRGMRYIFANATYERISGISREILKGKTNQSLGMPDEQSRQWEETMRKVIRTGRETSIEFSFTGLFGTRFFWGRTIPEFDKNGIVESVMMVARDVTERKRAEAHIRYVSFHDNVTGLYNRAYFEEEVNRLDTARSMPVSFIMGDVNNLKLVNDAFGHNEGDILLKKIADVLREACRESDIVARWGGDEFAVILPNTDLETVREVSSRIRSVAEQSMGTVIPPSISLGGAVKTSELENIYHIIRMAEAEMYDDKLLRGRENHERVISSLLSKVFESRPDLEQHTRRAQAHVRTFGAAMGLSDSQLENMDMMARLHDIGKSVIPKEVIQKPGRLNETEWRIMKRYPEAGYRIIKTFPETARISDEILTIRERWDGTGYPRGLKKQDIPYLARIFSIIDVYDAITHERPYGRVYSPKEAVALIREMAGIQFDPALSEAFVRTALPE